jgi:hypothetical protein
MKKHVVITNVHDAPNPPMISEFTLMSDVGLASILEWYGAFCAGDPYTVTVNGVNVNLDMNGCVAPVVLEYTPNLARL